MRLNALFSFFHKWSKSYSELSIRSRIAFQFTLIVAIILSIVFGSVYFSFSLYRKLNFENQLRGRAIIAAEAFLSEDNVTKEKFQEIQQKFQKVLSDEIITVFDKNNRSVFTPKLILKYSPGLVNEIRVQNELYFKLGLRECYGIYYHDNQGDYVIVSSALDTKGRDLLRFLLILMAATFVLSLVGVYFLGGLFARNALSPISNVIRQVSKMGASNLHLRVNEENRKDEIGDLAKTFNNLISRLEESFEMQRSFVSGASHEFRTPITSLIGEIEVGLSKTRSLPDYIQILEKVLVQAEKLNQITASLLDMTRADNAYALKEPLRLDQLLFDTLENLPESLHPEWVDLKLESLPDDASDLIIFANKHLMLIALGNIFTNALKFSPGKKVNCSLFQLENQTCISIQDYGIGIQEEDLKMIFQPFYRAENARGFEGTGIGLSLSDKIIKMYHGNLWIQSELGKGTRVQISFPMEFPA